MYVLCTFPGTCSCQGQGLVLLQAHLTKARLFCSNVGGPRRSAIPCGAGEVLPDKPNSYLRLRRRAAVEAPEGPQVGTSISG